MTEREALAIAEPYIVEALARHDEEYDRHPATEAERQMIVDDLENVRKALAPTEQEPVAWLHTKIEGVAVPHRPADLDKHPDRWEALYKTPPPCPTCEALARTVMLDQTSHDTTPPQPESVIDNSAAIRIATALGWEPKRKLKLAEHEHAIYCRGVEDGKAQRKWQGLTDEEIDQGLLRSDYAFKTAEAWRAGVVFAMTKLKEKNT